MKPIERLLHYCRILTPGDEKCENIPSTIFQFYLAERLAEELDAMGIDVEVTKQCYLYASIPATPGFEKSPVLGFIAHMDTVSDFADHPIKPLVHEHYDGGDLKLGGGRCLTREMFPHLPCLTGRTLVTSDGTTILGADDKAGLAEIMCLAESLVAGEVDHGPVKIAFTPDEEIGRGADHFDVKRFGADFAYTVDGGAEGEVEYENFNAAAVTFQITGVNVHPGDAKNVMVNAAEVGARLTAMLPLEETPRHTEGYQGFYHLTGFQGDVSGAQLDFIVRDHDALLFQKRKEHLEEVTEELNREYGENTVKMTWREQYRNMAEKIQEAFHLVTNAQMASLRAGVTPVVKPVRGGTDGARLSFMGLPCPNLGTGGYAFHGPYEHITAQGMEKVVQILKNIVGMYAGGENTGCDT